jgi:hypothetical protein
LKVDHKHLRHALAAVLAGGAVLPLAERHQNG